ncbi:zinc metalloprotease [Tenacibaculum maritimum]|uniref:hypothetical protein n=1 Tax=Tenacibaculum maritimum TaxID=107401 RepID=UPI003875D6B6
MKKNNLLSALAIAALVFNSCQNSELPNELPQEKFSTSLERNVEANINLDLTQNEQQIYTLVSSLLTEGKGFNLSIKDVLFSFTELEEDPFLRFSNSKKSYLLKTTDNTVSARVIKDDKDINMIIRITKNDTEEFYSFNISATNDTVANSKLKLIERPNINLEDFCAVPPITNTPIYKRNASSLNQLPTGYYGSIGDPLKKTDWKLIIYKSGEDMDLDKALIFAGFAFGELQAFNSFTVEYRDGSSFLSRSKTFGLDSKTILERFGFYTKEIGVNSGVIPQNASLFHSTPLGEAHIFVRKDAFDGGRTLGIAKRNTENYRIGIISTEGTSTLAHELGHIFGARHYDHLTYDSGWWYKSVMHSGTNEVLVSDFGPVTYRFYNEENRKVMINTIQSEKIAE